MPEAAPTHTSPSAGRRWLWRAIRLAVFIAILIGAWMLSATIRAYLAMELTAQNTAMLRGLVALSLVALVVLMAIPFVPGVEIGVVLLTALGGQIAPLVWLATVLALALSFAVGRVVPAHVTCAALRRWGLVRAANLIETLEVEGADREALMAAVDARPVRALARYRYVSLALALNLPGNVLLGGGGGLAMAAGISRAFPPLAFLITVAIAVLPVPLIFMLTSR